MEIGCKTWNFCSAGSTQSQNTEVCKRVENALDTWVFKGQKSVLISYQKAPRKILENFGRSKEAMFFTVMKDIVLELH